MRVGDRLVRFSTEKYEVSKESLKNSCVHLTNYSVNKLSDKFDDDEEEGMGHKWSISAFRDHLSKCGINDTQCTAARTGTARTHTRCCTQTPAQVLHRGPEGVGAANCARLCHCRKAAAEGRDAGRLPATWTSFFEFNPQLSAGASTAR